MPKGLLDGRIKSAADLDVVAKRFLELGKEGVAIRRDSIPQHVLDVLWYTCFGVSVASCRRWRDVGVSLPERWTITPSSKHGLMIRYKVTYNREVIADAVTSYSDALSITEGNFWTPDRTRDLLNQIYMERRRGIINRLFHAVTMIDACEEGYRKIKNPELRLQHVERVFAKLPNFCEHEIEYGPKMFVRAKSLLLKGVVQIEKKKLLTLEGVIRRLEGIETEETTVDGSNQLSYEDWLRLLEECE